MNPISNPHDRLFKKIWSNKEAAASFLKHYLPRDVLSKIDLKTLIIEKDSFVQAELAEYFSDILYSVQTGDRQAFVYLLFEHKSYPNRQAAFQIHGYMHTGIQYIETLLRYIMSTVPDMTGLQLRQIVEQSLSRDMEGTIMTLEEKLKQEGFLKGKLEGKLEAIRLGLKLKFGAAGSGLMDAIQKISDISQLNAIMEAIESASHVSDIRKMVLQ